MRILLLNWRDLAHPRAGGAERYVHEVATRWVSDGHDVTLFCARPPGLPADGERDGVRIARAGSRITVYREAAAFMRRTSGRWDAVVESVNTRPFFAHRHAGETRTLAIFHQLARDVWFHEAPLPLAVAGRYVFEPRWLRAYRGRPAVAVSHSTASDLMSFGIVGAPIASPGTPVPPPDPSPPRRQRALAFVGRLTSSKRPDAAVRAWRIARERIPELQLWVIGDGPMRDALAREAGEGMTVFGRVDEATKWFLLRQASLLLVPSVREGWGIVVMEAAAVGTPAIGYRVPGLVDSIRDGETGWLCEQRPEAMGEAVLRALGDPRRPEMEQEAQRWARRFTWDEAASRILECLRTGEVASV